MAIRSNTKSRSRDWASLPDLALDLIFQKSSTSLSDCLRFGAVCKPWFSFVSRNYYDLRKCMNSSSFEELPLLMIYPRHRDYVTNLYSVTKGKIISDLKLPYYTWRCCGSSHGWLAFQNPFTFCLFNPFSRETIHLPHLEFKVNKLILSNNPSTNSCDYEVAAMSNTWGESKLAILKPGSKTWIFTHLPVVHSSFHDVIYYNERYYVVTHEGMVLSINNTASNYEEIAPASIDEDITDFREFHLVKTTTNELLKVQINEPSSVNISKLVQSPATKISMFENLNNLGDETLFLCQFSSISVLASKFSGCKSNSIYYMDEYNSSSTSVDMIHLQDGSVHNHFCFQASRDINMPPTLWIIPSPKFTTTS